MRSYNANFITEKNKRSDGPAPVNLITFDFSTPVNISDRDVTPGGGDAHSGLVKDWGFIDSDIMQTSAVGVLGALEIPDLQLIIINSESPRFSDNFTTEDPPENVTVTVYQWFDGLLDTEKELIFKGTIFGQPDYNEYLCSLTIRGIFEKYNKRIGEDLVITTSDYPDADPDDIGKMLCIGHGSLENVPFRAVDAGARTTLMEDITEASATLKFSDSSAFLASGTIQIDIEQITYTGNANNQLTGCSRGQNGTTATEHDAGAYIAEIQTNYYYLFGCPVKSIDTVYVAGIRQAGNYTAYTGQTGDECPGYPGKAAIVFNMLPIITRQVNVDVDDTIDVSDTIDVDDTIDVLLWMTPST